MRSQKVQRGWTVAIVSTSSAALSHTLAGGVFPSLILWLLCTSLAALVCIGLSGRKVPRSALFASVLASQGIFHFFYQHSQSAVLTQTAHSLHLNHGSHQLLVETATGTQHNHSVLMLGLHTLAALLTYMMVRQADVLVAEIKYLAQKTWHCFEILQGLIAVPHVPKISSQSYLLPLKSKLNRAVWTTRGPPFLAV